MSRERVFVGTLVSGRGPERTPVIRRRRVDVLSEPVGTGGDVAALVAFDLVEDSMNEYVNEYGEPTIQCHKSRNVPPRTLEIA